MPHNATNVRFELAAVSEAYVFLDAVEIAQTPELASFSPDRGVPTTEVIIKGVHLTEATAVSFGEVAAGFTVIDSTTINTQVPFGASSAAIKVTTPYGEATSATDFIVPAPEFAATNEFEPTSAGAGEVVVLNGQYFTGVNEVLFNGVAADPATIIFVNDNQIKVTVPNGASSGLITVKSPAGQDVSTTTFNVLGPQIIATDVNGKMQEFDPESGPVGTTVTIYGKYFTAVNEVLFNGVTATNFTVNDTVISVAVPLGASTGLITVKSPAGEDVSTTAFDVPAPTIASFEPTSAGPGMQVIISGTNLSGVSRVVFLGDPATPEDDREGTIVTPVTSDTQLAVLVPADASTGFIQVIAPGEGKTATSTQEFTFVPAPVIASVATTEGGLTYSIVGKEVTITGQNFETATAVKLGTTTITPYDEIENPTGFVVTGTAITFNVPENATTGSVTVTTLGGEAVWEGPFEVIHAPVYSSMVPTKGPIGQEITITGNYFKYVSEVVFLGAEGAEDDVIATVFSAPNDTELVVTVPDGAVTGPLQITNPADSVNTTTYEVIVIPVIQAFNPKLGVPGDLVTIEGYNFTGTTSITFGESSPVAAYNADTNPNGFTLVSDSKLTVHVPADATTGLITVTNAEGTGSSEENFTIIQLPTITGISPVKGTAGETVVITGTNFIGEGITVTFLGADLEGDEVVATAITVNSATQITATVPAGAVTGKLMVTNAAGDSNPSEVYTVVTSPEIASFTPDRGKAGDAVTITGWLLGDVTAVGFNGTLIAVIPSQDGKTISTNVPTGATTGPLSLVVDGAVVFTTSENFTVIPAPTIVSFDPTQGVAGTSVTITGTNFLEVSGVYFNDVPADMSTVQINEAFDKLTVTVPYAATTGKIKITAAAGEAVSESDFTVPVPANITFTNDTATPTTSYANQLVTVRGQYFTNATEVTFNSRTATIVNTVTDEVENGEPTGYQLITVKAPFDGGIGKVAVTTPAGTGTSTDDYTVLEPIISSISAAEGYVDKTVITITGTLFTKYWDETLNNGAGGEATKAPVVNFNGTQVTATNYTDTEITVAVPNGATTGNLTVISGSGESAPKQFSVLAPVLTSVAPTAVYAGEQVVITGTNFINVTSMSYGGIDIPEFTVSLTNEDTGEGTITFTAPVVLHNSSNVLSVTSQSGTGTSTALTVYKPIITGVTETGKTSDTRVYAGVSKVTITGSRFDEYFNGTERSTSTPTVTFAGANSTRVAGTIITSTMSTTEDGVDILEVAVPANAVSGAVRVQSGSGTGQSNSSLTIIGAPTITGFSTYAGLEGATFTINGTNFDDASKVEFLGIGDEADEVIATTYTVTSPTAISVTVPTGATIGKIAVTTPYNVSTTVTSTQIFRVVKTPVIHDFTLKEGPSGYEVNITGESLIDVDGQIKVFFKGHGGEIIPAAPVDQVELSALVSSEDLIEARQIKVVVPNDAITGIIRVSNAAGETTTAASTQTDVDVFTVTSPVIVRFEHADGSIISASSPARIKETVLVRGYQLKDLGTAKIGSVNANFFERVNDPTTVEMLVPGGARTNTVSITAAEGNETSSELLNIAVPTITVTPTSLTFKVEAGTISAAQSYTVSATNLAVGENLNIAVLRTEGLNDFYISLDANAADSAWVKALDPIVPDASGTVPVTEIWVRSQPAEDASSDQKGMVANSSFDAVRGEVQLNSTVTPLPVELMSFKATVQGSKAQLTWVTASEKDNSHFEVETSLNGVHSFEKVGRVASKTTNSSIRTSYEFTHNLGNANGIRYYRLKQVDLDGTSSYSKVVAVTVKAQELVLELLVAPNPINYNSKVFITAAVAGKATFTLHNMTGKKVYAKVAELLEGENEVQLPVYDQLPNGLYILTVELNGQQRQVKVVKQ
ncbi:hypothetical protein GCM10027443_42130 [Pontibacter brevis]